MEAQPNNTCSIAVSHHYLNSYTEDKVGSPILTKGVPSYRPGGGGGVK